MSVIDTPLIFPEGDTARTRRGDPLTSHTAADQSDVAGSRREVMSWLSLHEDGLTDGELEAFHVKSRTAAGHKPYTGSRLRTARAELVEHGKVAAVGYGLSAAGNRATRWALR